MIMFLEYITGDIAKGGLGYDRDQIEYLYSDKVYFDVDTVINCGQRSYASR